MCEGRARIRPPRYGKKHPKLAISEWHLDEVLIKVGGARKHLRRPVDQHGRVLDILIRGKRNGKAAARFLRTLSNKHGCRPPVLMVVEQAVAIYRLLRVMLFWARKLLDSK